MLKRHVYKPTQLRPKLDDLRVNKENQGQKTNSECSPILWHREKHLGNSSKCEQNSGCRLQKSTLAVEI